MNEASSPSIKILIEQDSLYTFQPFTLTLELSYPKEYHPDREALTGHLLRHPNPDSIPPLELIKITQEIVHSDVIHETLRYKLEPLLPGKIPITFLEVTFLPNDSAKQSSIKIASPLEFITVKQSEPKDYSISNEIAPLATLSTKQPVEMDSHVRALTLQSDPTHNQEAFDVKAFPWAALGLFIALLLFTYFIRRILMHKKEIIKPQKSINLLQMAENALKKIEQDKGSNPEAVKNYIYFLSCSLREYLEKSFQTKISSLTTEEFREFLNDNPFLPENQKKSLLNYIEIADRIKFENYRPDLKECLKAHELVLQVCKIVSLPSKRK